MLIAIAIFGVADAAFGVWLIVRIINRRERWTKRTLAVSIGLPVLYIASFRPACWLAPLRFYPVIGPATLAPRIYLPLSVIRKQGSPLFADALNWYATAGNDHAYPVMMTTE